MVGGLGGRTVQVSCLVYYRRGLKKQARVWVEQNTKEALLR